MEIRQSKSRRQTQTALASGLPENSDELFDCVDGLPALSANEKMLLVLSTFRPVEMTQNVSFRSVAGRLNGRMEESPVHSGRGCRLIAKSCKNGTSTPYVLLRYYMKCN